MELFRSESMQLVQLIVPAEAAHDTVLTLGEIGLVQFKDMNPGKSGFQRTYYKQVKRCEEMLRRLRYFGEQMGKAGLIPMARPAPDQAWTLDELETKLEDLEGELRQITNNTEKLRRGHSELVELQIVLEKASGFFESGGRSGSVSMSDGIGMLGGASGGSLARDEETGEGSAESTPRSWALPRGAWAATTTTRCARTRRASGWGSSAASSPRRKCRGSSVSSSGRRAGTCI